MKFIRGFAILILFLGAGNGIATYISLPLPGNLIGMLLMLAALAVGALPLAIIEDASELLLSKMAIFFIPAGVGIVDHLDLLRTGLIQIVAGTLLSTLLVLIITAKTADYLLEQRKKGG